jgi:hypothetical protein
MFILEQERGVKKICCPTFFCSYKNHKIELAKKKIWANIQRIMELYTQKIVIKLSKICIWDPGSKIWDPEKKPIPDHGSRGQKDTGSATLRDRLKNLTKMDKPKPKERMATG